MLSNNYKMIFRLLLFLIFLLPAVCYPYSDAYPEGDSIKVSGQNKTPELVSAGDSSFISSSEIKNPADRTETNKPSAADSLVDVSGSDTGLASKTVPYSEYVPKWYEMITNIPNDCVRFYKQEFTTERLPFYLGMTVLTAGLIISDQASWKASDRIYKSGSFIKNWSDIFTEIGDGRTQFALAGAFGALGFITRDKRALRTASQIVEAVLASGGVVQVLKHITGRESPFLASIDGGAWRFFPNQIEYAKHTANYDAYPSGHICTSMAAFIVIAENYPEYKWIRPAGYTIAGLVGIGMANKGIHWYSDYPLGIALGYLFGEIIAHPEVEADSKNTGPKEKVSMGLYPYFNLTGTGVTFSVSF